MRRPTGDQEAGGRGFNPHRGRQHSFVEIDHEIFSTGILSLPLIQEGQLSVSGERMCTILVNICAVRSKSTMFAATLLKGLWLDIALYEMQIYCFNCPDAQADLSLISNSYMCFGSFQF